MVNHPRASTSLEGIVIGMTIMALGVILLLTQWGIIHWRGAWSFWPFVLIVGGLVKMLVRRDDGQRKGGWLVFFGTWLLLHELRVLRLRESWPLVLVAVGVSIVWKSLIERRPPPAANAE